MISWKYYLSTSIILSRDYQAFSVKSWLANILGFMGHYVSVWASQVVLMVKNQPDSAGDIRDAGSTPGSGRSPWGGHGIPLQYSCLENPMDPGGLQFVGFQRVGHDWVHTHTQHEIEKTIFLAGKVWRSQNKKKKLWVKWLKQRHACVRAQSLQLCLILCP